MDDRAPAPYHEPATDRLLGPLTAPLGRAWPVGAPRAMLSLLGLLAAAGALAALLAGARLPAAAFILLAALLDATGAGIDRPRDGLDGVADGVCDRYADTLVLAGMAAWSRAHEHRPAPLALGFVAVMGAVALSYMAARVQASAGRDAATLFAWTGRDLRLLVATLGALSGQVYLALVLLALLAHLPVLWALARLRTRL